MGLVGLEVSKRFSRGYFVDPVFFLKANFVSKNFQLLPACESVTENRNVKIHVKPGILFQIGFNNSQLFILGERFLQNYLCYAQLSFALMVFLNISFLQY